jgi:hypothetical protein
MPRERDRERKTWRESDKTKTQNYRAEDLDKRESPAKQSPQVKEYKAALEALFQKKPEAVEVIEKLMPSLVMPKVVEANADDPEGKAAQKRQSLLLKISNAQNPKQVSDTIDAFLNAGFHLPDDQETYLQMLEHRSEERVREAISRLEHLLAGQMPKRKPVLVQRLKRIEEHADEEDTRTAAAQLRRKVA